MKDLAKALSLGLDIATSITFPILLGLWIDQQFKVTPIGIILGIFIGLSLAFHRLYDCTKNR